MSTKTQAPTNTTEKPSPNTERSGLLQRKCECGNAAELTGKCSECQSKPLTLQRKATQESEPDEVPPIVYDVLNSPGQPLDPETRAFMESRFEHDFSQVRIHTDAKAAESAQAVNALAYTVDQKIVFNSSQYSPNSIRGRELIAHELTHTIQQSCHPRVSNILNFNYQDDSTEKEAEAAAARVFQSYVPLIIPKHHVGISRQKVEGSTQYNMSECGKRAGCPEDYCKPYSTYEEAIQKRNEFVKSPPAKFTIVKAISSPHLWDKYLSGGSSTTLDLTGEHTLKYSFQQTATTKRVTQLLMNKLAKKMEENPPVIPEGKNNILVGLSEYLESEMKAVDDQKSVYRMDFTNDADINITSPKIPALPAIPLIPAGNEIYGLSVALSLATPFSLSLYTAPALLAGGIGKDQTSCKAGAKPSPHNDSRIVSGWARVSRSPLSDNLLNVDPTLNYAVVDTVDFCPGNCGGKDAQELTVPLSRLEASGVAGDVPFSITFTVLPETFSVKIKQ
jgi:hypothetical protein